MSTTTAMKTPIMDSGERTTFDTGAVRDMHEGKGRFDLMPLYEIGTAYKDDVLTYLGMYSESNNPGNIRLALEVFLDTIPFKHDALLNLAVHFENGAKKYGEYNWQKGIPKQSFVDSACRHYVKFRAGWTDEDHQSAFLWNMFCLLWTVRNIKEE